MEEIQQIYKMYGIINISAVQAKQGLVKSLLIVNPLQNQGRKY